MELLDSKGMSELYKRRIIVSGPVVEELASGVTFNVLEYCDRAYAVIGR